MSCDKFVEAAAALQKHNVSSARGDKLYPMHGEPLEFRGEIIMNSGCQEKVGRKGLDWSVQHFECFARSGTFVPFKSEKASKVSEQGSNIMKAEF